MKEHQEAKTSAVKNAWPNSLAQTGGKKKIKTSAITVWLLTVTCTLKLVAQQQDFST